jgi:hypothetical protein
MKDTIDNALDVCDRKKADKLVNTFTALTAELNLQKTINQGLEAALFE